jgi:BlaI family penicillinase repressor
MTTKTHYSTLTMAEAEVMNVIWDRSPASVPDILDGMTRSLAYTTVMTTVRILEDKGFVAKCGKRGRAFLYQPEADRDEVRGSMSNELADRLYNGSVKSLVLNLVQQEDITADDLAEVKRMIEELEAVK